MRTPLHLFAALLLAAPAAHAQNWSLGVRTGPFVFGDFVERLVVTSSPFRAADLAPAETKGIHILRPKNVHTTVGIRYRF
ncbi:MAG TPA: hypothetical protein VG323_20020 [Thermoanaerobaculia bacterium]|nr:hypothetical protein [Thermoanaerobaculia bacterium]